MARRAAGLPPGREERIASALRRAAEAEREGPPPTRPVPVLTGRGEGFWREVEILCPWCGTPAWTFHALFGWKGRTCGGCGSLATPAGAALPWYEHPAPLPRRARPYPVPVPRGRGRTR